MADYEENLLYLNRHWSESVTKRFVSEVDAILKIIRVNPRLFPETEYKGVRRAVIRKQITLFYKEGQDHIYLVRFWNNYQDPGKLNV